MSALSEAAVDYLRLRNRLGHDLAEYHRLLPRFVAYLDDTEAPTVTVAAALAWAYGPDVDPMTSVAARRMTIARGFARHMAGIDPRTRSLRQVSSRFPSVGTHRSFSSPAISTHSWPRRRVCGGRCLRRPTRR